VGLDRIDATSGRYNEMARRSDEAFPAKNGHPTMDAWMHGCMDAWMHGWI